MAVTVRTLTGAALRERLDDVAGLRIRVFRDFPYLYDGDLDYERGYLAPYADSTKAILVGAFDGDRLVGAATGAPMEDHAEEFADALEKTGIAPEEVFYCAESVLLPEYRGQGIGHRFFDEREAHARRLGRDWSVFCSVLRPADDPRRPADYRPLDGFWRARGYAPVEGALAHFSWKDVGEAEETVKPLQVWMRRL